MCFQDALAEGRSRFSHYNEPSVEDEENVEWMLLFVGELFVYVSNLS
jgi:hypothetical protein